MGEDMKWVMGTSITGFLFLCGWMWWMLQQINKRVTYDWIQNQFKTDMQKEMKDVTDVLKEIRDALLGDMKSEGLISRVRRMDENCLRHHKETAHEVK